MGLLLLGYAGFLFGGGRVVKIVVAVAIEFFSTLEVVGLFIPAPEPGEVGLFALGFFASIFSPLDIGFTAEEAGAFCFFLSRFEIGGFQEGANVEADAVVEVGMPTEGLFVEWLPTSEEIVGWLAGEDVLEFALEGLGGEDALAFMKLAL